jgi:hypothetical protein
MTIARWINLPKKDEITFGISKKVIATIEQKQILLNQENIDNVLNTILLFLNDSVFPFFDHANSLQLVNDEIIDKVPQIELGKYIPGWYNIYKKQIIMKLCNNPNYNEYVDWLDKSFQEDIQRDPLNKDYQIFASLTKFLNSGKYKDLA